MMTGKQKEMARSMRLEGWTYSGIAQVLNLPMNTVKSFCLRSGITAAYIEHDSEYCKHCGKPLEFSGKGHQKQFCSDKCRFQWWNANRFLLKHRINRTITCAGCGREFTVHSGKDHKYCSFPCYIKVRYGKGVTL